MSRDPKSVSRRRHLALKIVTPFQAFAQSGSLGGLLLLLGAVVAFIWANSPWAPAYDRMLHEHLRLELGSWSLELSLAHWVNDALMAIFFLLVGLELKRALVIGELSRPRQAALGVAAALGGMMLPALIYVLFNWGSEAIHGWAIPMATDIAFSLAAMSVLGSRVPVGLKVFLTALAIVDDLGAVIVIGLFYTSGLNFVALGVAVAILALLLVFNRLGVRHLGVYLIPGILLWYAVYASGLHATVAGVLLAFVIPIARKIEAPIGELREAIGAHDAEAVGAHLAAVERVLETRQSPLHRLEHALQPYVNLLILPIFALFNAGLSLNGVGVGKVMLGVSLGLVIGKPLGVLLLSFLAVKAGLAQLPNGVTWRGVFGVGLLAGIGFTMSLFIAGLSFGGDLYNEARLGIVVGSLVSAGLGVAFLSRQGRATRGLGGD